MILGPPGCGKTTRLLGIFDAELERGVPPERIAFVTFTRAARAVALERVQERFAYAPRRLPWVRTIHAAAFCLLGLRPEEILDDERLEEFAARHGYELTVDGRRIDEEAWEPFLSSGRRRDDVYLYAHEWGRNCLLDFDQTLARCPVEGLAVPHFRLFVERYERFKRENGLYDFTDLLERVLAESVRPPVAVALIDEAHDLSPLQAAVVEAWFASCERSYVCADDDQAIYVFQGASPDWIGTLTHDREPEILHQSHRVPVVVHALAQRIIRANQKRVPKLYEPTRELGHLEVADLDHALDRVDGSCKTFILCRNRIFIRPIAKHLMIAGVPFTVGGWGGRSPYSDEDAVVAIELAIRVARGESGPFAAKHVASLITFIAASDGLLPEGLKGRLKSIRAGGSFDRDELVIDLGLERLLLALEHDGAVTPLTGLRRDDRHYFQRLIECHGHLPKPQVTVTSIHAAKGDEADLVLIVPDMTRRTYESYVGHGQVGYEEENRVFYVGVTRTRKTLILVQPRTRRHFVFPTISAREGVL